MGEEVFCLLRETFRDRFLRKVARMINFIATVAKVHGLREAVQFLEELERRFAPKESRGRRPFWN